MAVKKNYKFEKRQKDLAKQKKKEAKLKRKQAKKEDALTESGSNGDEENAEGPETE